MAYNGHAITAVTDSPIESAELPKARHRPTREEAEQAVRTLLGWIGEDAEREGLVDTPERVIRAYEEFFAGYTVDPLDILQRTFGEVDGYDEIVVLRDIGFESHCEHHMVPIVGTAHVAYLPERRVVGISKLARVVEAFAKRLQIQEKMTAQIANTVEKGLAPRGVAVLIESEHHCMTCRGIRKQNTSLVTTQMRGVFKTDRDMRREFYTLIGKAG